MLLKPIDKKEENGKVFDKNRVGFKVLFLVIAVVIGMGVIARSNRFNSSPLAHQNSQTTPTPVVNLQTLREEGTVLIGKTAEQTQEVAGNVLGEVSEVVEEKASDSAQLVIDYAYKNTMGQLISKLIESLPERQQEQIREDICK